jgi:hypothetical protein
MEKGFHTYGIGIVARDKELNTNVIYVYLTDKLFNTTGNISTIEESVITNKSSNNLVETMKLEKRTTITARWLGLGQANRLSAPDVRVGERVEIYRYGNNDDFYWEVFGNNSTIRGKETVTLAFKNTDKFNIPISVDNSYFITISTKDKNIQLHTSSNDGELTTYDIELDTKNGEFTLIDGRGNFFNLNSAKDTFNIKSNEEINLTTKKVNINASTQLTVTSPESTFTEHVTLGDMTSATVDSYNNHTHPESIGDRTGNPS